MKTAGVNALVREVLESLPQPYTQHVIEDVFAAIEHDPKWFAEYESECATLTKTVVNNAIGSWVGRLLGKVGERQVPSSKSKLVESYSILDTDAKTVARKPKEQEARQLMADYYQVHKQELPERIRNYREFIVELIMGGMSAEEAFAMALGAK